MLRPASAVLLVHGQVRTAQPIAERRVMDRREEAHGAVHGPLYPGLLGPGLDDAFDRSAPAWVHRGRHAEPGGIERLDVALGVACTAASTSWKMSMSPVILSRARLRAAPRAT